MYNYLKKPHSLGRKTTTIPSGQEQSCRLILMTETWWAWKKYKENTVKNAMLSYAKMLVKIKITFHGTSNLLLYLSDIMHIFPYNYLQKVDFT
jgi:membrane protein required for beta-lactamase induction